MVFGTSSPTSESSLEEVLLVVAETTRYPADVLTPHADIEDELGIDSVKRGEIAARLGSSFGLTKEDMETTQKARTLADLAEMLTALTRDRPSIEPIADPLPEQPASDKSANGTVKNGRELLEEITAAAARVTRYPLELLSPDADLEDELGIDSVKFGELIAEVRQLYPALPKPNADERPARTLKELASRVAAQLGAPPERSDPPAATPPIVPPAANGRFDLGALHAKPIANKRPKPSSAKRTAKATERPLAGRFAFISGSGRGLGRATAFELARRGATVVVNSFKSRESGERTVAKIRDDGGNAEHLWGSMARVDHVERIFDSITKTCPHLDFFIHNASDGAFTTLAEATEEMWQKSFRTNVVGLHASAMRAAKLMKPERGGRILTLSSVFQDAVVDYFGLQGTVKAAVEALTRFLAKELLPSGVAVNCVSFSSLDGEVATHYPEASRINGAAARRSLHGRRSDDAEAARVLAMLLGPDAAPMTGAVLRVDRGFTLTQELRT